jgi:hypothetical protein
MHSSRLAAKITAVLSGGCLIIIAASPIFAQTGQQEQLKGAQAETAPRDAAPRRAAPRDAAPRRAAPRDLSPRSRTFSARGLRGVPIRGTSRASIRGRNYSVWRSGYRARYGSRWRTFGALSALSVLVIGSGTYYPYAYISAAQPYCDGLTEEGCHLMWQEVMTLEGDLAYQCVAYCPWQ